MNSEKKILKLSSLKKVVSRLRRQGKKIALTNGCFDILHYGHVRYLETAHKPGRVLIIGLNSDSSVRKLKGPKRPIVGEQERAAVLAGLACVDYVTIFSEETPIEIIKALKPDVLIKGADWKGKPVAGEDVVKASGGKMEFVHYWNKFSTTNLIKSIAEKCAR